MRTLNHNERVDLSYGHTTLKITVWINDIGLTREFISFLIYDVSVTDKAIDKMFSELRTKLKRQKINT